MKKSIVLMIMFLSLSVISSQSWEKLNIGTEESLQKTAFIGNKVTIFSQ